MRRRIERIGLLDPAPASSFPISPSRFSSRLRLPNTFAFGSSSRALLPPFRVYESTPARLFCPDTFPGLPSLIAAPTSGVHTRGLPKPASFRPRRFSRPRRLTPPPAFAGLFHPATTSRVRSSGSFPREKPHELVARRCPLAVSPSLLPEVSQWHQNDAPVSRALLFPRIRRSTRWFRPRPARYPPELQPPSGPSSHAVQATFITCSDHGLSRPSSFRQRATTTCSCEPAAPVRGSRPEAPQQLAPLLCYEAISLLESSSSHDN
jgi:hypothetical protein